MANYFGYVTLRSNGTTFIAAVLTAVNVVNLVGAGYLVGDLVVSLSSGNPVFTINATSTIMEVDIREV